MSSDEILSGHFTAMDVSKDGYLDTTEMYKYISSKGAPTEPQTKADKIRYNDFSQIYQKFSWVKKFKACTNR